MYMTPDKSMLPPRRIVSEALPTLLPVRLWYGSGPVRKLVTIRNIKPSVGLVRIPIGVYPFPAAFPGPWGPGPILGPSRRPGLCKKWFDNLVRPARACVYVCI